MAIAKTDIQIAIVDKVKNLRLANGESQKQLADLLGVTNGHIGSVESLKFSPKYTLKQLSVIAAHYGVTTESLFREEGEGELTCEKCINRIIKYLD